MMKVKYRGRGGCDRENDGLPEIFKFTEVRLGTRCKFLFYPLLYLSTFIVDWEY